MIQHLTHLKAAYCDTDQMGFVHHSNYVKYYETARMEFLSAIGVPYRIIEDDGVIMPVTDIRIHYLKPAFFDDELTIETTLHTVKGPRALFSYKMYNAAGELINEGETTLAFASAKNHKPCHPPASFMMAVEYADSMV